MERRLKGVGNGRRRSRGKLRKHCKASGLRCKAAGQRRLVQYYLGLDAASRAERLKDTRRTGTLATAAPFVRTKTALGSAPAAARLPDSGTSRAGSNRPAEEGESVGRGPETEKQISCKRCACKNAILCLQIQNPSAQACCALGRMAYEDLLAASESDNQAGDAGFEQEALEKRDAVQPVVPTTGDAARDETADV